MKRWRRVAIVGVGLIGGSIGQALLRRRLADEVVGVGRRPTALGDAKRRKAVTTTTTDFARGVTGCDLIVICTPVDQIAEQAVQAARACGGEALITDVGSTKQTIVEAVTAAAAAPDWPAKVEFVGSHPLAGGENAGVRHSRPDLLSGRTVVVTPAAQSNLGSIRRTELFWKSLGAKVVRMAPDDHDRAVAMTSHVPHLTAAALAAATPEAQLRLTATGWRDATRIAAGDPVLWRQILLDNRQSVLLSLDQFAMIVAQYRAALAAADAASLERLLAEAKRIRDAVAS